MKLELYEERVSPTGGPKAEGAKRILGTPSMGPLTVVLREAVQNSWDARVGDHIGFNIHYFTPKAPQKTALLESVFADQPNGSRLRKEIASDKFAVLVFSDRGTSGLNGPVRADIPLEDPSQRRNFVDFVFEIGRDESRGVSGGTYGFGKASFFTFSDVGTVCIYTRCLHNGTYEERFIAVQLGRSIPGRITGRSWWGTADISHVEPVTGTAAIALATAIGMPAYSGDDCGTSIMVLAPRIVASGENRSIEERVTPKEVVCSIGASLVQWFWAKMIPGLSKPPDITFGITYEASIVEVPNPADHAPFGSYVEALAAIEAFKRTGAQPPAGKVICIESERPRAQLGHLCLLRRPKRPRTHVPADFEEDSAHELADQSHHVALLRSPHLVVKYLAGQKPPSEQLDIAGVFLVDERSELGEVEKAFGLSEPPVHDDWIPATLEERTHKIYVNGAIRRVRERLGEFTLPFTDGGGEVAPQPSLGAFSEMMGALLAESCSGTGARVQPDRESGGSGGGQPRTARLTVTGPGSLQMHPQFGRVVSVPFHVEAPSGSQAVLIGAKASVMVENGIEREPPEGAELPKVKAFVFTPAGATTQEIHPGTSVSVPPMRSGSWAALATVPVDAKVRVTLNVETSI